MARPIVLWSVAVGAAATLACGGSTQQELLTTSPAGRCRMSVTVPPLPAAGGQVTASLTAARDCPWSLSTSAAWLQLEPLSGQGDATLTVTAQQNPQGRARSGTIDVDDQKFPVTQEASPCRYDVTPPLLSASHQGGRMSVQLSTLDGCSWVTRSSHPWLRVVSPTGGEGSATLELAIDSNTGGERSAVLTVATLSVAVNQNGSPNDNSSCRFSLTPGSRVIPPAGGEASFSVATRTGCAWSVASGQPWIVILTSGSPIGSDTVHYRVDPNPSTSTRSGVVIAGTRRHVVTQQGQPPP